MSVGQFMSYAQLLLFGASAPVVLGATHYVCPRQTAEEQSAAFALISELLDANALDYHAAGNSLRALLAFSIFSMKIPYPSVGVAPEQRESGWLSFISLCSLTIKSLQNA